MTSIPKKAQQFIIMQAMLAAMLVVLMLAVSVKYAYSALMAGLILIVTNQWFIIQVFSKINASKAKSIVVNFYINEVIKLMLIIALMLAAILWLPIMLLPFLLTYAILQFSLLLIAVIMSMRLGLMIEKWRFKRANGTYQGIDGLKDTKQAHKLIDLPDKRYSIVVTRRQ